MRRPFFLLAVVLAAAALPALAAPTAVTQQGGADSRLVELTEAARLAVGSSEEQQERVTVLVQLLRADPVSSSTSVERTFSKPNQLDLESVSTSKAVFVSGPAVLVHEAVLRLHKLDQATPDPPPRQPRRVANGEIEDAQESPAPGLSSLLVLGLVALGLFVVVVLARFGGRS